MNFFGFGLSRLSVDLLAVCEVLRRGPVVQYTFEPLLKVVILIGLRVQSWSLIFTHKPKLILSGNVVGGSG